ncbi:MAG: SDR family oxidoreductase [Eubacterium sp.]|nr:SDR family oxidoreductase [Eubacterium sp.]
MNISIKPDLSGKVAAVTGGGGVLCSEFAKALAACGAKTAVLDRTLSKAEEVAAAICADGGQAIAVQMNVLEKDSIKAAHEEVLKQFGKCDILINGAGGNHPSATTQNEYFQMEDLDTDTRTFFDLNEEDVQFVFNLNYTGTLLPTQEFAKDMVGRKGCTIINVSSMNAYSPLTKIPAYSGAKAAISNFTQWLAVHFSKVGIRVNAIAPGFFSTAQNKSLLWSEDGTPTARTNKILNATPMGRFGEPDELLGTLLYLADDKSSSFVTGIVIPVDGGFSAYSGV